MVGIKTGLYWRLCWGLITPGLMLSVLIYTLLDLQPLTYKNVDYPTVAHGEKQNLLRLLKIMFLIYKYF